MGRYDSKICKLKKTEKIASGIFDFLFEAPDFARQAQPGQFANIRLPGRTLRRPISICGIDREGGTLRFVFQIRGGVRRNWQSTRRETAWNCWRPWEKAFPWSKTEKRFDWRRHRRSPLLGAAAELGTAAVAVLGFRNREAVILEEDFKKLGAKTLVATDDGSYGFHGLVTELAAKEEFEAVFACGPAPMLKAVRALAEERHVPCFLSLEERMACGIGACLGCATPLLDEEGNRYYGHVCKDGPVFDAYRVILE